MNAVFLTRDEVLEIHMDQIHRYGGESSIRDNGLLDSALAQPMASFAGEMACENHFEMAAAYLYHIVHNHPFVDGNKRTGAVSAIIFLELNGYEFLSPWEELAELVLLVADGRLSKKQISSFFKEKTASD